MLGLKTTLNMKAYNSETRAARANLRPDLDSIGHDATKHRWRDQPDIWLELILEPLLRASKMQVVKLTFHITRE